MAVHNQHQHPPMTLPTSGKQEVRIRSLDFLATLGDARYLVGKFPSGTGLTCMSKMPFQLSKQLHSNEFRSVKF